MNEVDLHIEAEQALLGAILIEGGCKNILPEIDINENDFTSELHREIFNAMLKCQLPNIVTVPHQMWLEKKLTAYDLQYIRDLIADNPNSLEYQSYALAVKDYSNSRRGLRKPVIKGTV